MLHPVKSKQYWKEILVRTKTENLFEFKDELNLQTLVEAKLLDHKAIIKEVSNKAEQLMKLERQLVELE